MMNKNRSFAKAGMAAVCLAATGLVFVAGFPTVAGATGDPVTTCMENCGEVAKTLAGQTKQQSSASPDGERQSGQVPAYTPAEIRDYTEKCYENCFELKVPADR